ncbi:MAG: hypothetical protein RIT28_1624 [Pseudomonadota bacterium]
MSGGPVHAYAALACGAALQPFEALAPPLGPYDIEIQITHCGVCHSDVHLIDDDWGLSQYPLVPGHEIVGTVQTTSPLLPFALGERVGVGWQRGACLHCAACIDGRDNDCPEAAPTCVGAQGGFADRVRVDGRFAARIPEAIPSALAAPLLCAGVTVFAPLRRLNVRATTRVGVIGIGGLGHLGLQFARSFGCQVTALSSSPDKEAEARSFGAEQFICTHDPGVMRAAAGSLDLLLNATHVDLDWGAYLELLSPGGTLCFLGTPPSEVIIPPSALFACKTVTASLIGSRSTVREMLAHAARHGVRPQVELLPMRAAQEAVERVRANKARYRIVLETD